VIEEQSDEDKPKAAEANEKKSKKGAAGKAGGSKTKGKKK